MGGAAEGALLGTAQLNGMGDRRPDARRWIPVNVGAWAAGILWTFAPSPLIDESTRVGIIVAVYAIAGALMALTVAALTATTARLLFSATDR
jgi:hypothetical protein